MKAIQTCLWFDDRAEEAVALYAEAFRDVRVGTAVRYTKGGSQMAGRPQGSVMCIDFEIAGSSFLALNGGPHFRFNPSMSFFVACESANEIERLWKMLARETRMPLDRYPWSERYGWCADRFGVEWQLTLGARTPKVSPALLFANGKLGKAEEALRYYASVFPDANVERIFRDEKTGAVLHSVLRIGAQTFVAMEGPLPKENDFSPAVSFVLPCDSQEEIDTLWSKLSAVPEAEHCAWLADKFGVSWQVVPADWSRTMATASDDERDRLMAVLVSMKKPNLQKLKDSIR